MALSDKDFHKFRGKYRRYLSTFDGFISCFPPAFLEIYLPWNKPILVLIATRYESPYTDRNSEWARFDNILRQGFSNGQLTIAVNNRADGAYLQYFTGITASYVPSLCEYTRQHWRHESKQRILVSRGSLLLRNLIEIESGFSWKSPKEEFGSRFSWADLHQVGEIFYLPYNVSTMTLFELATSGVPVSVPSPNLLMKLREVDPEILSEISFYQIRGLPTNDLASDNPNKTSENEVVNWWLDKADFYDIDLMPNIRIISALSELSNPHPLNLNPAEEKDQVKLRNRNLRIYSQRHELLKGFLERVEISKSNYT